MNTCKYCDEEIKNTNAPECDRCWEIQWHCVGNPELVAKILAHLTKRAPDARKSGPILAICNCVLCRGWRGELNAAGKA